MKKLYNILYLANSGNIIGGGQISLMVLIEGLTKKKFYPMTVCPAKGNFVDELKKLDIETSIVKMETLRRLNVLSWVNTIYQLVQLVKNRKIDLIHSNGSRPAFYGGIAAKLTNIPLIWHVRIADSDKLFDKLLARLADKIITVSNAVGKRFDKSKKFSDKTVLIYNGIDLDKFNPDINGEIIREELELLPETALVGILGRLDWYKGHKYFLQAAKKVTETMSNICFIIVGDGENRKRLEIQRKKLDLIDKVIFMGNREDIPQILAAMDIYVLSSVSEGFGRSAVEAMACGKAVIATKVGGLSEIVVDRKTGRLVPPKDPNALAKAIIGLLKDKNKANRMGQAGRTRAEKMFSLQQNIKQTQEIYEEILEASNGV